MEPVLRETAFWSPPSLSPPNARDEINSSATHGLVLDLCGVEVDPDTGKVRVDRYVTIHDAGRILHPGMADGQIRGGFSNGVGAALYEHFAYGQDGSFRSGTFADYTVPTAMEVPDIEIHHIETPSPVTPLGAKGIGEGNCMSTPVAIANAVADALGVDDVELPLTPTRVLDLLRHEEPERPAGATPRPARSLSLSRDNFGMTGEGSMFIAARPESVWALLLDPQVLKDVIPGCRSLNMIAANTFHGEIVMGAGPVKGVFAAEVRLSDLDLRRALRLSGSATGLLGRSDGEAVVTLMLEGDGTRLSYRYGVDLSGKVAAVGGRMLDGAARMLIAEFFKRLARHAESTEPRHGSRRCSRRPSDGQPPPSEQPSWLRRLIGRDKGEGQIMKPAPFEYIRAESVEDVVDVTSLRTEEVSILAGGQSLIAMMSMRLDPAARPHRHQPYRDLRMASDRDEFSFGRRRGSHTIRSCERFPESGDEPCPCLAMALPHVGHFQTRNKGTVCGSIAHADPSSELPLCMAVLDGKSLQLHELSGARQLRRPRRLGIGFFHRALADAVAPTGK